MNDFVRSLLLVLCGLSAFIALVVAYLWYFVFGKSLRRVLMAGLGIMLNRDSRIDIDDDPKLVKRPADVKKEMPQETAALDFQSSVNSQDEYIPRIEGDDVDTFGAQAVESNRQTQELVISSFEGGRFKRITDVLSRAFLRQRLPLASDAAAENIKNGADSTHIE